MSLGMTQLILTYTIEILMFAFALLITFDFVAGLLRLWQQAAPATTTKPVISDSIYNFGSILDLADSDRINLLASDRLSA
jgi:hypothetical protein